MTAHRIPIGGGWSLWRWCMVRGTGFPLADVLALAAPAAAAAADRLIAADDAVREAATRATTVLRAARDASSGDERSVLVRALKALEQGRVPEPATTAELRALAEAEVARADARAAFERAAAADNERVARELRRLASAPRFREAVTWQSRSALHEGIDRLLASAESDSSKQRRRERLVASYVQRYCTKNESIGFFGPFGWGTLDLDVETAVVEPGPALLARRRIYFEQWAIDALAEALASDDALKPYLAPRLAPIVAVDGTTLHVPVDRRAELSPLVARLLAHLDGETPARELARALMADEALELADEDEVYALLAELEDKKYITWTLEVPASVARPEDALAALIDRIADDELRGRARAALERLCAGRAGVAAAAGDPPAIERALADLDRTFLELTGEAAMRHHGETYGARGIVYEDCRRDLAVRLGRAFVDRVGPIVALLGESARWYTHEIATRYRAALRDVHARLRVAHPGPIDYIRFWDAAAPLLAGDHPPIVEDVANELSRHWSELVRAAPGDRRVELASRALAAPVAARFAAPAPGWPGARHVAPDILIAARGVDALERGELAVVIGEIHLVNSLLSLYALHEHPEADLLIAANDDDLPGVRVAPVESRRMVGRGDLMSWSPRDLHLELGASRSWRPREQVLRAADLVVEDAGGSLVVADRKSGRRFDVIAFLEQYLSFAASGQFKPHPRGAHVPRIAIDGVVVCRERWELTPAQLPIGGDRHAQFLAMRRWARELGLPRHVFVKVPEETKPIYVDFESPLYVELLATIARKASSLVATEMLPAVEDAWLPDGEGHIYACELRFVAVDPRSWAI